MNGSRVLGRWGWGALGALLLFSLLVGGCQTRPAESRFADWPGAASGISGATPVDRSNPDILQPGDTLVITFTDLPITQPIIRDQIKQDGTITLMLNKTFVAADGRKTRGRLEQEIRDYYVPAYFKSMTVSVVQEAQTRFYFVDGEVRQPNRYVYIGSMTVTRAIASAGGFTDYANKKKVRLIHPDGKTETINCKKVIDNPSLDRPVYPGDTIHVRRTIW